jgi:hypothetical protein
LDATPRLVGKRRGTWRVGRQENTRPYDPKVDGWNVHKVRRNPTADELIAQQQLRDISAF